MPTPTVSLDEFDTIDTEVGEWVDCTQFLQKSTCDPTLNCTWDYDLGHPPSQCIAAYGCGVADDPAKGECWGQCFGLTDNPPWWNKCSGKPECQYIIPPATPPYRQGHCLNLWALPTNTPVPTPTSPPGVSPTSTPKPTSTPAPSPLPSFTNGSFDIDVNNDNKPDSWTLSKLQKSDRLDGIFYYDGVRSFKFTPKASGAPKEEISQWVSYINGAAYTAINLDVWHHMDRNEQTGKSGVVIKAYNSAGNEVDSTSWILPKTAHNWTLKRIVLVPSTPFASYKIFLWNKNEQTILRLDALGVSFTPNANLQGISSTPNALSPAELATFN